MTNWKKVFFLGAIILFFGILLRVTNPNSLPVFADEAIYVRWSQVMRAEATLRFLPLSDGKQPLFMWLTIPFFKVISDPLLAGRAISALADSVTIMGVAVAAYVLFKNTRLSLLAGAIYAVLPYSVFFGRVALADSLLTMFYVWAFNLLALSLILLRLDLAMLAGFSLGFAWLTKSPAIFAIALSPSLFLLLPKPTRKNLLFAICYLIFALVIATGMYNILRLGPEFHMIALRNRDYVYPITEILKHPLDPLIPHLKDSLNFYFYLATPIGLLFTMWGIFEGHRSHLRQRVILTVWFLVPILIQSTMVKAFTARYLLFTVPFAAVLIAHAIEHFGQKSQKHILTFAAASIIIIPAAVVDWMLLFNPQAAPLPRIERAGYLEEWTAGTGLQDISAQLAQFAKSGPVLVGSEGFFGTPFDALQLYLNNVSNVRVIGVGVWIDSVHEKLQNALADNQVFLVVNSSRFHHDDPVKIGLKLLGSYPKALRPDGTREYTLFFQVTSVK